MKRNMYLSAAFGIMCLFFASCSSKDSVDETAYDAAETEKNGYEVIEWEDDPTIGKVQAGYYKRIGIVKDGETYEEMLELKDIENKGYLLVYDDGTAVFDLDGEKTEYFYDKNNLYSGEDTERTKGIPYVFIGGRLVVDDGETVTQYLKLSDEEIKALLENGGDAEMPDNIAQSEQEMHELFETVCSADEALALSGSSDTVVFELKGCTSGKETWDAFYKKAMDGEAASVLCAHYYVLDKERVSEELYEEEKDLYPMLFFYHLEYDGEKYTVSVRKSDEESLDLQESFRYLQHFTGEAPSTALYTAYDNYVLVDDLSATWEGITAAWASSQSGVGYRCCTVYQDCIGWKE